MPEQLTKCLIALLEKVSILNFTIAQQRHETKTWRIIKFEASEEEMLGYCRHMKTTCDIAKNMNARIM